MIRKRNSGIRTVNTSSLVDISSLSELMGIGRIQTLFPKSVKFSKYGKILRPCYFAS